MKTAKKKGKKIDWIKIKNDYVFNNFTLRGLVEKYKISLSAVREHCKSENWVDLREEEKHKINTETTQKLRNKEIARRVAVNEEHIQLYNDGLEVVKNILQVYQDQSAEFKRRGNVNPFNLEKIFSCIEKAQKGQRIALNIDKEDVTETEPDVFIIKGIDADKI